MPHVIMRGMVRDLYKRFLLSGRQYPQGLEYVREKAKIAFFRNKDLVEEVEVLKAVAKGRYMVREIDAISKLHKYRAMNKRYAKTTES